MRDETKQLTGVASLKQALANPGTKLTCGGDVGRGGACRQSGAPDWLTGTLGGQGAGGTGDAVARLRLPQLQGGGGSRQRAGGAMKL